MLLLSIHHIVADGWSMGVLIGEIAAIYPALRGGETPALAALPIQYADYATWQRGGSPTARWTVSWPTGGAS